MIPYQTLRWNWTKSALEPLSDDLVLASVESAFQTPKAVAYEKRVRCLRVEACEPNSPPPLSSV